jgi:hypothetical protein
MRLTALRHREPQVVTPYELECDSEPRQSNEGKRAEKPLNVSA